MTLATAGSQGRMNRRTGYLLLGGVALVLVGLLLPREWYDALPKFEKQPPLPVKGVTLLQITLALEGLALIWLSTKFRGFTRLHASERLPRATELDESVSASTALRFLCAIVVFGLALRVVRLDADLWLDEITPTPKLRELAIRWIHAPFRDIFSGYELLAYMSYRALRRGYWCKELPTARRYPRSGNLPTKISGVRGNLQVSSSALKTCADTFNPRVG